MPALRLSKMLNAPNTLNGVDALQSVLYSVPPMMAVAEGKMALAEASTSTVLVINAMPAGLKN